MALKFGILMSMAYEESIAEEEVRRRVEQTDRAQEVGLDAVWLPHHLLSTPLRYFQPASMAGRLAAVSGEMSIGFTTLAPFVHPISLAEEVCSLDIMTGGHAILGLAQGWRESERQAFQVSSTQALDRFLDTWEVVPRLWTETNVNFEGNAYSFKDVTLGSKPLQQPHPGMWIGASKPRGVRRIAQRKSIWLSSAQLPTDTIIAQAKVYEEELAAVGGDANITRPALRNLVISTSKEAAHERALSTMEAYYGAFKSWGLWDTLIKDGQFESLEDLMASHVIFGDVDGAANQLIDLIAKTKRNFWLFKIEWPGMDQEEILRTIELVGRELVPAVRALDKDGA